MTYFTGRILAGWLLDGTGTLAKENFVLELCDGIITRICPAEFKKRKEGFPPDHSNLINLSRYCVLPALMDAHVHLSMSGTEDPVMRQFQLKAGFNEIKPIIEKHIRQHLSHGIIAVRDGGDRGGYVYRYVHKYHDMARTPLIIRNSACAWKKPGRYGRLVGRSVGEENLATAIEKEILGPDSKIPDQIKVINSGINSLKTFSKETSEQFNLDEMRAAVNMAANFGIPVMVHANGRIPVQISVDAGCKSIEHGFFMGEENLKRMADKGTFWVPTAVTMKSYGEKLDASGPEVTIAKKNLEHQLAQISMAKELGVRMAIGTDAGSLGVHHGAAVAEEIRLFIRAGLSLENAISCATSNVAELLGLKQIGQLLPGKEATFIAIRGGLENLQEKLNQVEKLFIKGSQFFEK